MQRTIFTIGMTAMLAIAMPMSGLAQSPPALTEVAPQAHMAWVNPKGTVKVELAECADKLCGWVVWASDEARRDARDGGTPDLIGVELLRDYHQTDPDNWTGRVFVPDWGKTFYSTIRRLKPDQLKISGCILGGWICKSQIWRKV